MPTSAAIRLFAVLLAFASDALGQRSAAHRQLSVAEIVRQTSDAVVQIVVADKAGNDLALGSGFIVSADGKIVTNFHVIKGAHSATAKLANGSFFRVEGVLAADADGDLVLLKVQGKGLPFLALGSSTGLQVGDHVVAIGSPLGLEGTVSDGIVSALREETPRKRWIQTTAPVSHGNSGGPLLDMAGSVVGVITWGVDLREGQNLNFAIPSGEVKTLLTSAHDLASLETVNGIHSDSTKDASSGQQNADNVSAEPLVDEALKKIGSKQYEQAVHIFKEAIGIDPGNADAWHGLGLAHALLGQSEESIADFKEAVSYRPSDEGFQRSLGISYLSLNRYADALPALQEAVGISPSDAVAWFYLGKTHDALQNYDQSIRCYKNATLYKSDYAEAWYEVGVVSKDDGEAIAALTRAVTLRPDYSDAWVRLGSTYDTMKRYSDAISAYKKEIELKAKEPKVSDARIWYYIGIDYSNLSEYKSAEQASLKALDLEKSLQYHTADDNQLVTSICLSLSLIYGKMGKHGQADYYNRTWIYMVQHPN